MKKNDLKKLALLGISGGILLTGQSFAESGQNGLDVNQLIAGHQCGGKNGCGGSKPPSNSSRYNEFIGRDVAMVATPHHEITEHDLLKMLNDKTRALYESMSPKGRALALQLANQSCKGMNDCKGLNSCKTDKNNCAGQGSCQGTSKGPFKDKNKAVEVAAKHMQEQRANMSQNS